MNLVTLPDFMIVSMIATGISIVLNPDEQDPTDEETEVVFTLAKGVYDSCMSSGLNEAIMGVLGQ